MTTRDCYGRECKVGWGYNKGLNKLIPAEDEYSGITSEVKKEEYYVYDFSLEDIYYPTFISLLLEPTCKRSLDFRIIFEDIEYWAVQCFFIKREEKAEKFPKYPLNCDHFVKSVNYGINIYVHLPKFIISGEKEEVKQLFEKRNFDELQTKIQCKILINYSEIRKMTLGELMEFIKEFEEGKHAEYDAPISFTYEKLTQESRETVVNNQNEFAQFLTHLYCAYRKIEMKMEEAGCSDILPDIDLKLESLVQICFNLENAKNDYKSMDKNNFLNTYPILKKLFFCYTDYIRYSIEHVDIIDEEKYLPGSSYEISFWYRRLNTWYPIKTNGKWIDCMDSFIVTPPGYEKLIKKFHQTVELSNFPVVSEDKASEPYIKVEKNEKILFGLVNMNNAKMKQIPDNLDSLESECPQECTEDLRKWICAKCGIFVRIELNSNGQSVLYCNCGSKEYSESLLSCNHPSHPQDLNSDDLLPIILEELQEFHKQNERYTDFKVVDAIVHLTENTSREEVSTILSDLQNVNLTDDIQNLINIYLNETL